MESERTLVPASEVRGRNKLRGQSFGVMGRSLWHKTTLAHTDDDEFQDIGLAVFESEDLTNALLEIFLALCANGIARDPSWMGAGDVGLVAEPYLGGFYVPCERRVVLSGMIDTRNDRLLPRAGLVWRCGDDINFTYTKAGRHRAWIPIVRGDHYLTTHFHRNTDADGKILGDTMLADHWGVTVRPDGEIYPCRHPEAHGNSVRPLWYGWGAFLTGTCLNAEIDAANLWQVETAERVLGGKTRTPLRLGVDEEKVKSLFYAREAPLTETGRRRPILHWVRAHERRLRTGIPIDVRKHMRGVTEFEMDGFDFRITSPLKWRPGDNRRPQH